MGLMQMASDRRSILAVATTVNCQLSTAIMRSFWSEPFLWIHLAGLGAFPLFLGISWLGLAVGDPLLPPWLEVLLVASIGIAPVLWMQWSRPFYIFSILAVAMKPEQLTEKQQRLLTLFKTSLTRLVAVFGAIIMLGVLWQLYRLAPIVSGVTLLAPTWRPLGLLLASLAFLASNLFLQVPLSVMRVLLAPLAEQAAMLPYPIEKIDRDFTIPGWRVKQILPPVVVESATKS